MVVRLTATTARRGSAPGGDRSGQDGPGRALQGRAARLVRLIALGLFITLTGCTPLNEIAVERPATPTAIAPTASAVPAARPTQTSFGPTASSGDTPGSVPTTPPDATPLSEESWPQEQALLPGALDVLNDLPNATRYRLDVTVDVNAARLWGQARIRYTNDENVALSELYLRLFPNMDGEEGGSAEISDVTIDGAEAELRYEMEHTAVRLPLEEPLPPGESAGIALKFEVTVPLGPGGNYGTFSAQQGVMALAHFYPFVPVYDDEGWNVELAPSYGDIIYGDISFYEVALRAPDEVVVVATGAALPIIAHDDGTATWRFVSGPARDVNIVLSHRFDMIQREVGEVKVNTYFLPGDRQGAEGVLDVASEALRVFARRFGPYPYTELDVVPTYTGAAGVEYPGLIVIAERLYGRSDTGEWVVAHEVAHQWWYAVVGNDQVDEPWLDEALTQYATSLYIEDRYGPTGAQLTRQGAFWDRWQQALDETGDRPVAGPVASFAPEEYGPIVYGKGPIFFHRLRERVGDMVFNDILRAYYRRYAFSVATGEGFLDLAENVSGQQLDQLYQEWILQ